ncbi:hypothetical protein K9P37_04605 [Salmonella enterica subsp. enterica serovar Choleraesuis]|uniref:Uncharacterized protein n=1 Tax=Salmonella enterica TaxID=28901 RepID=A0A750QJD7_SALER|nr:hypothetical protein [Salmonella enterica]EGH8507511.1 hypothetical protein [Salmonella enterica]EGL2949488.1 hypothetical protein [Salmonella enterica subsp. enterica serovar Paratyphi C]EGM2016364.1 hypothetical protein [Salmonella enterica]EIT3886183.1 hypothetical protein [Salmonella enterica subsp. enterica serovar Paratyphi C]MBZ3745523.1 hypothetical protein [Salmonella enterica subsp. enterica serovar Choleraesuis]
MFLPLSRGESEREDRRTQGISGLSFPYYIIVCIAIYFFESMLLSGCVSLHAYCLLLIAYCLLLIAFVFNRHVRCDLARVVGANIWLTLRYIKRQGEQEAKVQKVRLQCKKYRVCTVHQSLIIILVKGKEVINNGTVYLVHGPEVEGHFPLNHLCI